LPWTSANPKSGHAVRRQNGITWAARGTGGLIGRDGNNGNRAATGPSKNFASEIEPGTDSFVGDVDDPTSISQDQVTNRAGKIASVSWRAELIVDHGKPGARLRRTEKLFRERRTMHSEKPRRLAT